LEIFKTLEGMVRIFGCIMLKRRAYSVNLEHRYISFYHVLIILIYFKFHKNIAMIVISMCE